MTRFVSEALGTHDRSGFTSGQERIDRYFRQTVSQDIKRNYAACYVLLERETSRIAGFYTLSAHSVSLNDISAELAKKLPRYPSVPVVLIGWLGRDVSYRGAQVGTLLLYDAIARLAKSPVGAYAICADAIDAGAAAFYLAHGFQPLFERPHGYFLPMKSAIALAGDVTS